MKNLKAKVLEYLKKEFSNNFPELKDDPEDDTICRIFMYNVHNNLKIETKDKIRYFIRTLQKPDNFDFVVSFREV